MTLARTSGVEVRPAPSPAAPSHLWDVIASKKSTLLLHVPRWARRTPPVVPSADATLFRQNRRDFSDLLLKVMANAGHGVIRSRRTDLARN